jgi:hypothetical protein
MNAARHLLEPSPLRIPGTLGIKQAARNVKPNVNQCREFAVTDPCDQGMKVLTVTLPLFYVSIG